MSEFRETYNQLKDEQSECPSAETIRLHVEGRLEDAEARRVAFHLDDCASCVGLLERLDPSDPPDLPAELQEEMAGEISRRLGFEVKEPTADTGEGWFIRLLRFRVPALVPATLVAMALALVWGVGGSNDPLEDLPPIIQQLPIFTIDQALSRTEGEPGSTKSVETGATFVLEIFLDRLDLGPGDSLRFGVTDEHGTTVLDGKTAVLEDYNVRLALTFNRTGTFTVILKDRQGAAELERVMVEAKSAD